MSGQKQPEFEGYYWVCRKKNQVVAGETVELEEWLIAYYSSPGAQCPWTVCGSEKALAVDAFSVVGKYLGTDGGWDSEDDR